MGETQQTTLPFPEDTQPTLEESEAQLVEDGVLPATEDDTAPSPEEPAAEPPAEERPEWLPEKFNSAEDMAKSYAELEKKLSQQSEEPEPPEAESTEQAPAVDGLIGDAEREFLESGELSDATFDALEKAGIPRATVEAVRDMRMREAEANRLNIVNEFGGDDQVNTMQNWAADNYEDSMIERLNGMLNSGDYAQTRMAMATISTDYNRAVGTTEPSRQIGGIRSGPEGFRSTAEMLEAINDPRYKNDDAFRSDVERKIANMDG